MGIVDDKINEIATLCAELHEASIEIAKLQPVSHLSKVQWTGIIGAVQEYRAGNRLVKMMNAPLYKEWSFYQFGFHIGRTSEKIVESISEIQKNLTKDDERLLHGRYNHLFLLVSEQALQQPEKTGGGGCFGMLLMLLSVGSIGISALTVLFAIII